VNNVGGESFLNPSCAELGQLDLVPTKMWTREWGDFHHSLGPFTFDPREKIKLVHMFTNIMLFA